jgi:hypothetical protein
VEKFAQHLDKEKILKELEFNTDWVMNTDWVNTYLCLGYAASPRLEIQMKEYEKI